MEEEKKAALNEAFEQLMAISLNQVPLEGLEEIVDPKVMGYGTTVDEQVHDLEGYISLIKAQEEQVKAGGLDIVFERKEVHRRYSPNKDTALVVEEIKATISSDEIKNQLSLRFSAVMEYKNESWKLIHWHGSVPSDTEDDAWHVNEWKAENERLEKLVAEQTSDLQQKNRDLEIEAALERVRSRSMAMHKSEELSETSAEMFKQIKALGLQQWSCGFNIFDHENNTITQWLSSGDGRMMLPFKTPSNEDVFQEITAAAENGESLFTIEMGGKELEAHYSYMKTLPVVGEIISELKDSGFDVPTHQVLNIVYFNYGYLVFITYEQVPEYHPVYERFADVFEQSYTRFLDLQKAEAQAKEAQIEAALERVRSRSMAMHKSDEIGDVAFVLFQQLKSLGGEFWGTGFGFCKKNTDVDEFWFANENGIMPHLKIPHTIDPAHKQMYQGWKKNLESFSIAKGGKELKEHYKYMLNVPDVQPIFQGMLDNNIAFPKWQKWHAAYFKYGYLLAITTEPYENDHIFKRFAKVFEQAYTRFLDLQKAEAQARDNQIELALERIRAQATGMQVSSDLLDIVVTMHAEFTGLGHEAHYFWHMRWLENTYQKAMTSGDGSRIGNVMELPRNFHQNEAMNEWEQNEESIGIFTFDAEAAIDYVDRMISEGRFDKIDHNAPEPDDIRAIGGLTFVMARTTHGEIGYSLPGVVENPPAEDMETLERFAGVFDLAYRRFEDLLDAEKRAYESAVEASLERVRGMATAMNHSDDLMQIAEAMFKEMEILKINPLRYGIAMIDGEKKEAELWASTVNDGHYLDMLGIIPLEWHPMLNRAYEAWSAQHEELIYKLEGKELSDYYQRIGPINPAIPDLESLQNPETNEVHYCSFFPFNHGILYAFTDGEPGEEGRSILTRFSSAFEQAHIRYHDLQKAELQARQIREERDRLEVALKELEATKDQLVQQEKLASLGQLTAGIAHEIKNPLNFVNNFSELSVELIEEARDEVKEINSKFKIQNLELSELLNDIEANLKTINKHGTRADNIVKSMLEHSRGGTGKLEPTDLNALVKEFVNLSFHGMRAGKDPINVDLQFELDESIGEVPLIAEDFSRVIINLCNNGFDAMREKLSAVSDHPSASYKPKLTVRASSENGKVTIEIEDNGSGISDEMRDKIMQPFFTTKKGTEGTGLGLSITNDIIKAHGGELKVKTEVSKGTSFIIQLSKI